MVESGAMVQPIQATGLPSRTAAVPQSGRWRAAYHVWICLCQRSLTAHPFAHGRRRQLRAGSEARCCQEESLDLGHLFQFSIFKAFLSMARLASTMSCSLPVESAR
jgi:hypothetical protein